MLSESIKEITKGYINNMNICDVLNGEITRVNPLEVKVSAQLILSEEFLIIPEFIQREKYDIEIDGTEKEIIFKNKKLKKGDKVIIVKSTGGQRYLILGRVMNDDS